MMGLAAVLTVLEALLMAFGVLVVIGGSIYVLGFIAAYFLARSEPPEAP
jgi:hypothetical protein